MTKVLDALSCGGQLVVIETFIDDERRENVAALTMSLTMLVGTESGSNFCKKDCDKLRRKVGFAKTELLKLVTPINAVVAYKSLSP